MSKVIGLLIIFILTGSKLQAQDPEQIKDIIESLAENLPEDQDMSEITERLNYYLNHPISLNHATPSQLKELVFLSPLQINNFFAHLKQNGLLTNVLELQGIDGFDLQTINRLLPFVSLKTSSVLSGIELADLYTRSNNDLIFRYGRILQTQRGFNDLPGNRYLGSPDKILLRYKYNYADVLSAALVAEKDAGEYLSRKQTGPDHLSFNISIYKTGRLKKLIFGDYSMQFGQGLTLWSGFAFGKGPDVTSVAAKDTGLKPYQSSNEAAFFRGLAATLNLAKHLDLTSFISFRKLDASLKHSELDRYTLQNINTTGLHRTASELKNKKSLEQLIFGSSLQYLSDNLNIGLTTYYSEYQHSFVTGTQLYNKYAFAGKHLVNTGLHYNYTYKNIYFYGETAQSLYSGWAILNGAMVSLTSRLSAVLLHRNYDRDYHSFFSNSVGEATEVSNEKGIYIGVNYIPLQKWICSAYADYFRFPWLKYRIDSASSGFEILGQTTYTPSKKFKITWRYKLETKQQNSETGHSSGLLDQVVKQNFRIDWIWQINKKINLHHRSEIVNYQKDINKETGFMILQDFDYKPVSSCLSGNFRIAFFHTPSYDSRIYAYEDDVLYGAGSGIYSNTGIRSYLNIRIRLMKRLGFWARYAIYLYRHKESIGSGLDEIPGNRKSDLKLQVRYQF